MAIAEQKPAINDSPIASSINKNLKPEEPKTPVLTSRAWKMDDGSYFDLAELPHNHDACDHKNNCNGTIPIRLVPGSYSEKLGYCRTCKEPVVVNLTAVCIELNLSSLLSTLIIPNPYNREEILKNREDIQQEINRFNAFTKLEEEAAERLRLSCSANQWWPA